MRSSRKRFAAAAIAAATVMAALGTTGDTVGAGGGHGHHGHGHGHGHGHKHKKKAALTLTILHNNDGESSLLPLELEDAEYGGAARFARKLRSERFFSYFAKDKGEAKRRAAITLNSGDNFLAGTTFEASRQPGAPFYDAEFVRQLRYDALAIGNHEFDFGPEVFAEFVEESQPRWGTTPFVSANLDYSNEPSLVDFVGDELVSSTIVRKAGHKIGVIGLTTTALRSISSPGFVEVLQDLEGIAQAEINMLKKKGVKIIILQSHLQGIQSEIDLVSSLKGVDVVIGGGGDEILADENTELFPGDEDDIFGTYPQIAIDKKGREVPVVTTPGNYRYVGLLEVTFNKKGKVIKVDTEDSGIKLVTDTGPEAVGKSRFIERTIEQPVAEFVEDLSAAIIGQSEVDLDCERNEVRGEESNCASLVADAHLAAGTAAAADLGLDTPQVAFQNGGGVRGEIDQLAGPISIADTFRIQPFGNFVAIAEDVPAEAVRQIIEEGAIRLPDPGDGGFTHVSRGTQVVIDPSQQARVADQDSGEQSVPGERVRELVLADGTVVVTGGVTQDVTVDLVQLDFSISGGDAQPDLTAIDGVTVTIAPISDQQSLQSYIENDLGGQVTGTDYPRGGEGRLTIL